MWCDWPQSVHPVGPGSSGPMQDHVRVYTAQVGRWESVSLQFPRPPPILACPSPIGHSSCPILSSSKACQGCRDENRIPPSVKGMLLRWRDRKTYRLLDFRAESFQYVSSLCRCSPRHPPSLPMSSRQSVGWCHVLGWTEKPVPKALFRKVSTKEKCLRFLCRWFTHSRCEDPPGPVLPGQDHSKT